MDKAYSRINWVNEPNHSTPINATNLNAMDSALDTIDDRVVALDGSIPTQLSQLTGDSTHRTVTDAEKTTWNGKADTSAIPTALSQLTADATHRTVTDTEKQAWNGKSVVSVTQIKSSGEKIAEITVNGNKTDIYASAGGGGGGAVDSVNGKTGDVVLTASDVGALADNTPIPSGLSDLTDVDTSGVTDGQILKYNATSGKWVNGTGGGGTSDYTDLTNKPSVNGVTLSGNKTSADLGIFAPTITSPTSGQVIKYDGSNWVNGSVSGGGSNRNLLDNPWFTVNQKGFTSGTVAQTGETVPFIDRWIGQWYRPGASASTYTYTSNGLQLNTVVHASGYEFVRQGLNQIKESITDILGKRVTFSIKLSNGEIKHTTFTISSSGSTNSPAIYLSENNDYFCRISITPSTNSLLVFFDNYSETNKEVVIRALKLELGTESTLALDVAPNYTEELLKCQRYYYRITAQSNYSNIAMGMGMPNLFRIDSVLKLPTHMRTTPTLNVAGTLDAYTNGSNITSTSISVHSWCGDIIALNLGFSSSDTIQSAPYILRLGNQGDYIEFKAEL